MHLQVDKSTGKDDAGLEKGGVPRQNTAPERSQSETDLFFRCPHCMFPLDGVPDPSGHLHKCSQHLDFVARGYFQTRKKCELGKHCTSRIDTHYMDWVCPIIQLGDPPVRAPRHKTNSFYYKMTTLPKC